MDPATAYSAFLAGEGDVCVLTGAGGTFKMLAESDKYIYLWPAVPWRIPV